MENHHWSIIQICSVLGFGLGGYLPARKAAYQYYAEHQHNLPASRAEAIIYYRRRNYRIIRTFLERGGLRALQMSAIGSAWCACDYFGNMLMNPFIHGNSENVNYALQFNKELFSGAICGSLLGLAGKGHNVYYAWRGVRLGATLGATVGCMKVMHFKFSRPHSQ